MAYGAGRFVCVNRSASTTANYSTTDGITWTSSTLASSAQWLSITFGNGFFVAAGRAAVASISWDGLNWISSSAVAASNLFVLFAIGRFFLFPEAGVSVANFDYPNIFGAAMTSPGNAYSQSAAYGGGYMVVLSSGTSGLAARVNLLPSASFNIPVVRALDPDKLAFMRVS
jgi:hypothetical protein